jgi:hypothetical protein
MEETLVTRLRKRAEIRRQIPTRKSVQNREPDRIADLLEEAAKEIDRLLVVKLHSFEIDLVEYQRAVEWMSTHPDVYEGAIGGRYSWEFTPTGLGVVVIIKDAITKTQKDVTDYDGW